MKGILGYTKEICKESKGRREVGTIARNKFLACWGQGGHGSGHPNYGEVIVQGKKRKKRKKRKKLLTV